MDSEKTEYSSDGATRRQTRFSRLVGNGKLALPERSTVLIATMLGVTTILWTAGHFSHITAPGFWPWPALSQLTILWSTTLMSVVLLAVVRATAMNPLFGGLDRAVRLHRSIGLATILLLFAHVVCLIALSLDRGTSVAEIVVPFSSPAARSTDIIVFYAIMLLAALAYEKQMPYERWLFIHRFIGILLVAGTIHAATEPGTIADYEPLRTWIIILILVSATAWLYRIFLFDRFGPLYRYKLERLVSHDQKVVDLELRPVQRRMMYEPGTFVFIRIPSLAKHRTELHPFSISSSPVERDLRVSIRIVGDFTGCLPSLALGTPIEVYGPFGGFTPHRYASYRRLVLIGAGIGITPFLGMLKFELTNQDFRRIWLYYVSRNKDDAVYDSEIRNSFLDAESYIDYYPWQTTRDGRISAQAVADEVAPLDDYAVMLCGSAAFVEDMARQFRALGIPQTRIITEELEFR